MEKSSAQFLERAGDIASYYGFRPLREVNPELFKTHIARAAVSFANASTLCAHCITQKNSEPVLAYWASPSPTHLPASVSEREAGEFSLQISGQSGGLGEIMVLKTLASILEKSGAAPSKVRVNAFGDRDSRERFARELSAFVRRRLAEPQEDADEKERLAILEKPQLIYNAESLGLREALSEAPRPVNFLSERSRSHFKELLEYLEHVRLPYELDDTLGGDEREPRIVFALDTDAEHTPVIASMGGRYDDFVSRLAGRRDGAAVHAGIYFRKKGAPRSSFSKVPERNPKLYFIQLGLRAKLQGLGVVDALREAHIPVAQSFDTTHLGPQLDAARKAGVSYVLIMGQREALDGTVIVRSMKNSSQEIIEVAKLPKILKNLKV